MRDGLTKYDRSYDGWHGLVAHVDDAAIASNWQADLAKQPTPPGMRHNWHLGIVISVADRSARLGYIDPTADSGDNARTGEIALSSIRWARAVAGGQVVGGARRPPMTRSAIRSRRWYSNSGSRKPYKAG
jgi:penicillin-binding protein 1A